MKQQHDHPEYGKKCASAEVFETLAAFLDVCGLNSLPVSNVCEEFCSSLKRLADLVESMRRSYKDGEIMHNRAYYLSLFETEREAEKVRAMFNSYLQSTSRSPRSKDEYNDALSFYIELESTTDDELGLQMKLSLRSLIDILFEKSGVENELANGFLLIFDNLYCQERGESIAAQLRQFAFALQTNVCLWTWDRGETLKVSGWGGGRKLYELDCIHSDSYETFPVKFCVELVNQSSHQQGILQDIYDAHDIMQVVSAFVDERIYLSHTSNLSVTLLLLFGPTGSGKTFLCNEIEKIARSKLSVHVIHPSLHLDLLRSAVGEVEDRIMAIFARVLSFHGKTLVLLDNLDAVVGETQTSPNCASGLASSDEVESHCIARSRSTLFSMFDRLRTCVNANLLVICTSKTDISDRIRRFDKVFGLKNPTLSERHGLIASCLAPTEECSSDSELEQMLNCLAESSIGKSFADISHICRQGMNEATGSGKGSCSEHGLRILQKMKERLETASPESLRLGAPSNMVAVRVFSAHEVSSNTNQLFGKCIEAAWRELEALVIHPLCYSNVIDQVLHNGELQGMQPVCGGVLISGPPGCGKSSLAFQCARDVAKTLPSMKLLDVSCTSLIQKEVGSSEQNVRWLFEAARAAAPCIVLLDGIENVAAVRGNDNTTEGTMNRVLSTLLTELDGVRGSEKFLTPSSFGSIAVIGITHDASWVDPAVTRPGRLDKVIQLGELENEARFQIAAREFAGSVNSSVGPLPRIEEETKGMTAAQIISLCNNMKTKKTLTKF